MKLDQKSAGVFWVKRWITLGKAPRIWAKAAAFLLLRLGWVDFVRSDEEWIERAYSFNACKILSW